MKALCVTSPNNIVIEERRIPQIQSANEVLVRIKAGGICGSDMITHHFPFTEVPKAIALIENPEVHNGKVVLLF